MYTQKNYRKNYKKNQYSFRKSEHKNYIELEGAKTRKKRMFVSCVNYTKVRIAREYKLETSTHEELALQGGEKHPHLHSIWRKTGFQKQNSKRFIVQKYLKQEGFKARGRFNRISCIPTSSIFSLPAIDIVIKTELQTRIGVKNCIK